MSVNFGLPVNVKLPPNLKPADTSGKRLLEIERSRAVRGAYISIMRAPYIYLRHYISQSFSSDDLAKYLYGQTYLDRIARIMGIIEHEEAFSKDRIFYEGRNEKYRHGLRKASPRRPVNCHQTDSATSLGETFDCPRKTAPLL